MGTFVGTVNLQLIKQLLVKWVEFASVLDVGLALNALLVLLAAGLADETRTGALLGSYGKLVAKDALERLFVTQV